jgi:hypothetical protein
MNVATTPEEIHHLVNELNFAQKVEPSHRRSSVRST